MMFVKLIEDVLRMLNVAGTAGESTYVSVTMDTKEIPMEKLVSVRFQFFLQIALNFSVHPSRDMDPLDS